MKNTFGESVALTLFGESHGTAIGAVLDGRAPGIDVDEAFIAHQMRLRRSVSSLSTPRAEKDEVKIVSGVFEGKTMGTPITFIIENKDTKSEHYSEMKSLVRPGHADYTANEKYHGFSDYRGGGHFSGRLTAPIVAAGALAISALRKKGIYIGTHILSVAGIRDRDFINIYDDILALSEMDFAALDKEKSIEMKKAIEDARADGDSVGGVLETVIIGLPKGVGEPWFDSLESRLSHMMFSIPAVKGVEFGDGFALADMRGSEANDNFTLNGTETNRAGGILGGISNGMPIVMRCAVKPTPSISKPQRTVNIKENRIEEICVRGRHDPAIVHRARVVMDSAAALVLCDMLALRYGTDFLAK